MKVQGVFLVAIYFALAFMQLVKGQPRKDCQPRCGNVTIEYPFGTSPDCYYAEDPSFNITCNEKDELIFGGNKVINISHRGELRVLVTGSYRCYNSQGILTGGEYYTYELGTLTLSDKNRFTAVGCDTYAFLRTYGVGSYSSGCMSVCNSPPEKNGECSGKGCCQTSVPRGNKHFRVRPYRFDNHSSVHSYNPCSYAFVVENGEFNFNAVDDLRNLQNVTDFPVVLDRSIGDQTCQQVGNKSICGGNSECLNSSRGTGYNCKCLEGFDGNPYLSDGCQDIDECTTSRHNCSDPNTCTNKDGGFECKCPSGFKLNTTTMSCASPNETPKEEPKYLGWTTTVLGTTIGFLFILLVVSCIQQRM